MTETVTLYRPVGQKELDLISNPGYKTFPPRLATQPIFYAVQIARDWNTKDAASGYSGYVTRFAVNADFLAAYSVKTVGNATHQEYWIPAEDLENFNASIVGLIEVIAEFHRPAEQDSP